MRWMWAETGINGVILTAASRVFSFQSFLLDVASWSWDIHPNIIPLPFRLPKQVSCSDNKVSSLIHIASVHVTIATKERLPGYSEIHFVIIITSRKYYARIFSPYYLFRLQCDFMCCMPWKTHGYSAILSELLIFPWQQLGEEPGAAVTLPGIVFERNPVWTLTIPTMAFRHLRNHYLLNTTLPNLKTVQPVQLK
jgi:hypothetical protein